MARGGRFFSLSNTAVLFYVLWRDGALWLPRRQTLWYGLIQINVALINFFKLQKWWARHHAWRHDFKK
jgi:hypothetical protein